MGTRGGDSFRPGYRDIATISSAPSMGSLQTDRPRAALDTPRFGSALDKKIPETWRLEVRNVLPRIPSQWEGDSRRVQRRVSVARHGCWKRHPNKPVRSCSPHDSHRATRFRYRRPTSLRPSLTPLYSVASNTPGNIGSRTRCALVPDR